MFFAPVSLRAMGNADRPAKPRFLLNSTKIRTQYDPMKFEVGASAEAPPCFKLNQITKDYREAAALCSQVNLFGFVDDEIFLTKSGDCRNRPEALTALTTNAWTRTPSTT